METPEDKPGLSWLQLPIMRSLSSVGGRMELADSIAKVLNRRLDLWRQEEGLIQGLGTCEPGKLYEVFEHEVRNIPTFSLETVLAQKNEHIVAHGLNLGLAEQQANEKALIAEHADKTLYPLWLIVIAEPEHHGFIGFDLRQQFLICTN